MSLACMLPTPSGAALFKLVAIKPADDPSLAPDEDLSTIVVWYDPSPHGALGGVLRKVYAQSSPVGFDQASMSGLQSGYGWIARTALVPDVGLPPYEIWVRNASSEKPDWNIVRFASLASLPPELHWLVEEASQRGCGPDQEASQASA